MVTAVVNATHRKQKPWLKEAGTVAAIALFFLLILPLLLPVSRLQILGRFLSLAIVALGIDLVWGYTGLLSLGHGIFFALGGYALAMHLNLQLPAGKIPEFFGNYGVETLPFFWEPFKSLPLTLLALVIIPALVAGILGYVVFRNRIRGVYFSILTQAALVVFFNFFNGQQKLINGTNGLKTASSQLFGAQVGSDGVQLKLYGLTLLLLMAVYGLCRWLTGGRFGRLLVAIRDDEPRVRFSGYDPTSFKVLVFAVSGAIAGIAGALYTVQSGIVSPQYMDIAFSIEMVIWVAVGGRGTLVGAVLGALLVNWARVLLSERFPEVWLFFQGALFLIVVTVLPDGIIGWFRSGGPNRARSTLGFPPKVQTYPAIDLAEAVQQERETIHHE
ncbi:MAG: urea ABC transporter permease subunit UrtC [Synechococcales cyanobacterium RU_4_20]|nr:urea ABC transporter permease subunit UrtC [Synechococcales cyanobacterium RU_4_20]